MKNFCGIVPLEKQGRWCLRFLEGWVWTDKRAAISRSDPNSYYELICELVEVFYLKKDRIARGGIMKKTSCTQLLFLLALIFILLPAIVVAGTVPDTGLTKCYDKEKEIPCPQPGEPFYGQDGSYTINPHSYIDLGNGVIKDNVTGLEWKKYTAGSFTWDHAIEYANKSIGWRLPTVKELGTILDWSLFAPRIDMNYFFMSPVTEDFWSSTESVYSTPSNAAWYVDFGYGRIFSAYKDKGCYVRLVRGEQSTNNFVDNGDGTVTDTSTGLMWQQSYSNLNEWEVALHYCENLTLAGYDDWRLPNINELQSIVDYNLFDPALDTTYFHIDPNDNFEPVYLSSTTFISTAPTAPSAIWKLDFSAGYVIVGSKGGGYIRAVRGGQIVPTTTTTILSGDFQILNHMMTKQIDLNGCSPPTPTDTFTTKDTKASCWMEIVNLKAGDVTVSKWYDPYNNAVGESTLIADKDIEHGCIIAYMYLSRGTLAGNWHVDFYHNDIKQFTEEFTIVKSGCLATSLLQDSPAKLEDLRKFRNRVLFKSKKGREYIKLFYRHSPELTFLVFSDHSLLIQSTELLKEILPQIKIVLSGRLMTVTPSMLMNIETILNSVRLYASPALQEDVEKLQSDLKDGRVFEELKISVQFH